MGTKTKLVMGFKTDTDKRVSISVDEPKVDLTEGEILHTMNLILEKNIFSPDGATLVALDSASVVTTGTTEYDLAL